MTLPLTGLPEYVAGQLQPHIPINTALRGLEQGATRFVVIDDTLTAPPGSPADGDAYRVASAGSGAWAGKDDHIAYYSGTAWVFVPPRAGLRYGVIGGADYQYADGSPPGWGLVPDASSLAGVAGYSIITDGGTARTFALADASTLPNPRIVRFTGGASVSATVPDNATVAFPLGAQINLRQAGAGLLTVVEDTGVTVNPPFGGTLLSAGQGASFVLVKVAMDEWDLTGQVAGA